MVRESVSRLKALPGSFSSLNLDESNSSEPAMDENTPAANAPFADANDISNPLSKSGSNNHMQEAENEQLRREVAELQSQLEILRSHLKRERADRMRLQESQQKQLQKQQQQQQRHQESQKHKFKHPHPQTKTGKGIVLEMPKAISCLKSGARDGVPKDHQSLSTEDDQDTVEPSDWEAHQSAKGLKHRNLYATPDLKPTLESSHRSSKMPHREDSNDDSISSGEDFGDEEAGRTASSNEKDGLLRMELEPVEPGTTTPVIDESFWECISDRAGWLVGLLVLQSMSSFIIARNENLLKQHSVIVRFLTMLVGAGGNAGNQASVRVIRGLAVGTIDDSNTNFFLRREFLMGATLSLILGAAGCIRAAAFMTPWHETVAITMSLFMIVIISIVLGALLPLGMKRIGFDPAHSSTTIQVVMDILGVSITVCISALVLGFNENDMIVGDDTLRY